MSTHTCADPVGSRKVRPVHRQRSFEHTGRVQPQQKRGGIKAQCVVAWEKRTCDTRFTPIERLLSISLATFWGFARLGPRRSARELGVQSRTSYRCCWWLRHTDISYETDRQLEGTVEADDLSHTAGQKGHATQGGLKPLGRRPRRRRKTREPGRGHDDKERPAISAWVSRQGAVVIQATRDLRCRRCRKRPTSRCTRAVGSTRTRPAALGP